MLIHNHQLNAQQLTELTTLSTECKNVDRNIVPTYQHLLGQNRPNSSNILYYQQHLIGFLSTFFFYDDACEIALMVAPAFRRQGVAINMLKEALPLVIAPHLKKLIFSTPHDLNNHWLSAHGFCYQHSEYQMRRDHSEPILNKTTSLVVRPATYDDIPILCLINDACFPTQPPDTPIRLHALLHDSLYQIFIAEQEGKPVGKAHICWQQDSARLTDIAVLPHVQKRGFGSILLGHCINYCLNAHQSNINLDVETQNQQALQLYTRLGFVVNNAYDYWTIPIETIKRELLGG